VCCGCAAEVSVTSKKNNDIFGCDELDVAVKITNTGLCTNEYRAFLYSIDKKQADKEPDTYWENISKGKTETINVSTTASLSICWDHVKDGYWIKVMCQDTPTDKQLYYKQHKP
jgi:hypothetical protein